MSCGGLAALPRGAIGLSVVCDCGISRSYSLLFINFLALIIHYSLFFDLLFTIHYKKGPLFTNHYTPSRPSFMTPSSDQTLSLFLSSISGAIVFLVINVDCTPYGTPSSPIASRRGGGVFQRKPLITCDFRVGGGYGPPSWILPSYQGITTYGILPSTVATNRHTANIHS